MTIISLKNFILTGNFGPIALGTEKRQVYEFLGQPNEIVDFGAGMSGLFYNGFEFFYWTENEKIFAIQNDNLNQLLTRKAKYKITKDIIIDTSFLQFGQVLSYENLTQYLSKEKIIFKVISKLEFDIIKFNSGVTFDFENDEANNNQNDRQHLKLNGIRHENFD